MYTEEKLRSKEFIRLYKFVGNNSLKALIKVEEVLSKRTNKRDLNIQLEKESFTTRDNTMHYTNSVHINSDGTYLKTNVTKNTESKLLDISLELGVDGYDYFTGERFDRKQAKVEYTYENDNVEIKNIKDEIYFNNLEIENKKTTLNRVLQQKK